MIKRCEELSTESYVIYTWACLRLLLYPRLKFKLFKHFFIFTYLIIALFMFPAMRELHSRALLYSGNIKLMIARMNVTIWWFMVLPDSNKIKSCPLLQCFTETFTWKRQNFLKTSLWKQPLLSWQCRWAKHLKVPVQGGQTELLVLSGCGEN